MWKTVKNKNKTKKKLWRPIILLLLLLSSSKILFKTTTTTTIETMTKWNVCLCMIIEQRWNHHHYYHRERCQKIFFYFFYNAFCHLTNKQNWMKFSTKTTQMYGLFTLKHKLFSLLSYTFIWMFCSQPYNHHHHLEIRNKKLKNWWWPRCDNSHAFVLF